MNSPRAFEMLNRMLASARLPLSTKLRFGPGCRSEAPDLVLTLGRRPLVVTTRSSMQNAGFLDELVSGLLGVGLKTSIFDALDSGPTTGSVDAAARVARQCEADCIIALGGGTVIDGAKAVAAVVGSSAASADLLHGRANVVAALPLLAIPATAGTGSEMNRSAILTDPSGCRRDGLRSDHLFPRYALVDPEICMTQPPDLAARTAFDALSHAIESLVSPRARTVTDGLAEAAVTLIADAIVDVAHGRATPAQHANLALAAALMGVNLSLVGTCLPHRVDKAVCALFPQITHGQCVAFFYPAWARRSWPGAVKRFAHIARVLDAASTSGNEERDAASSGDVLERFLESLGLGNPPSAFGVRHSDLPRIIERVAGDLSANPLPVSTEDLQTFLEETIK